MPITLKIRPLDRRFRTSVYRVTGRGKLRNGEKVCLGKPVEKDGKFNYAVYKVNDSNSVVGNLGSITTDDQDLSGEENRAQKLNDLDESVWNELNKESPVKPEKPVKPEPAEDSSSDDDSIDEISEKKSSKTKTPISEGSVPISEGSVPSSEGSVPISEGSVPGSEGSVPGSEITSTESKKSSSKPLTEGSPTTKDMDWFEDSDRERPEGEPSPKTKKGPLLAAKSKPKTLKIKIQPQKNIPVYT